MSEDAELLRCYATENSETAFAELIRRHVDLVYSAALRLMNGPSLSNPTRIADIVRAGKTPEGTIERLYLMTLSRRPTAHELERYTTYVKEQSNANKAYADLLWALLNSSAFAMNH